VAKKPKSLKVTLTLKELKGRIPTPPKGVAMRPTKGKGAYKRKPKHKEKQDD